MTVLSIKEMREIPERLQEEASLIPKTSLLIRFSKIGHSLLKKISGRIHKEIHH